MVQVQLICTSRLRACSRSSRPLRWRPWKGQFFAPGLRDLDRRATRVRTVDLSPRSENTRDTYAALSLARLELLRREHTLLPRLFCSRFDAIRANARERLNCQLRDSINNATTHTIESSPAILVLSTPASPPMKSPRESWFYRVSRVAREREREKYNKIVN